MFLFLQHTCKIIYACNSFFLICQKILSMLEFCRIFQIEFFWCQNKSFQLERTVYKWMTQSTNNSSISFISCEISDQEQWVRWRFYSAVRCSFVEPLLPQDLLHQAQPNQLQRLSMQQIINTQLFIRFFSQLFDFYSPSDLMRNSKPKLKNKLKRPRKKFTKMLPLAKKWKKQFTIGKFLEMKNENLHA